MGSVPIGETPFVIRGLYQLMILRLSSIHVVVIEGATVIPITTNAVHQLVRALVVMILGSAIEEPRVGNHSTTTARTRMRV
jgi:hypothetical protein